MSPPAQSERTADVRQGDHGAHAASFKLSQEASTAAFSARPKVGSGPKGLPPRTLEIPPISKRVADNHSGMPGGPSASKGDYFPAAASGSDQVPSQVPKGVNDSPLNDQQKELKNASPSDALKAAEALLGQGAQSFANIKIAQDFANGNASVKQELVNLAGADGMTGDKNQVVAYMTENSAFRSYEQTLASNLPKK